MSSLVIAAIIAIVVYMGFSLAIGLGVGLDKEAVSTSRGYFVGKGTQNFVLFFTTVATWFSTGLYQAVIGSLYKNGIGWIGISTWQLLVVSCMGILGPRIWKLGKVYGYSTPAQMVGDFYKSKPFRLIMAFGMLAFCLPSMMAQIRGVSWAMNAITDGVIPFEAAIVVVALVVGIYVYFGGFTSQAWVDTAQGILFIIILWGSLIILAGVNGGWAASWQRLAETAPDVLFYKGTEEYWSWRRYFSFFFIQGLGGFFAPYVLQRSYAARNGRAVKKLAGIMGPFFCLGICFPVVFIGLNMHVAMPALENPENALVLFSAAHMPFWGIFCTVGILAAGMSTISSILVTCSSILAVDFGEVINRQKNIPDEKVRNWGRRLVVIVLLIGAGLSLVTIQTLEILINLTLAGFCQLVVPMIGMFWLKNWTPIGVTCGYVAGLLISFFGTIVWNNPLGFMGGFWGLLANIVITIVVSLFTKKLDEAWINKFLGPVSVADKD